MSAKGTFIPLLLVDADRAAMMQAIDAFGAEPPRTFLAYATAPGEVASDGAGANSPYSAVHGAADTRGSRRAVNTTSVSP